MKTTYRLLVASFFVLFAAAPLQANEAEAPAMDPETMQKMQQFMTPNENHSVLKEFAGSWKANGKMWMKPGAPPHEMTGEAKNEMVYEGRFLKQTYKGPWMGKEFEGLGYTGYDNVKKKYVSVWLDSIGTGIMTSEGDYHAETKELKLGGTFSCPVKGGDIESRSVWKIEGPDRNTYTSYHKDDEGVEYKAMEIVYTRV